MSRSEKFSNWEFDTLMDLIIKEFSKTGSKTENIYTDIKAIEDTAFIRFVGFREYDPFPPGGEGKEMKAYYESKTLKSEMLKSTRVVLQLINFVEKASGKKYQDWRKAQKNSKRKLVNKYPNMKEDDRREYLAVIKRVNKEVKEWKKEILFTEAAFIYLAEDYSTKSLATKISEFFKHKEIITVGNPHKDTCLSYVNIESFIQLKEIATQKFQSNEGHTDYEEIQYDGFYYIFSSHEVFDQFELKIKIAKNSISVEAKGVYDHPGIVFSGKGQNLDGRLHIQLSASVNDNSTRIYMILESGYNFRDRQLIRGAFIGTTSHIYSKEIFLARNRGEDLDDTTKLQIQQYLFWQQRTFKINPDDIKNKITVNKHAVSRYEKMVGFWRTWSFDTDFNIVESLLRIRKDYQIYHYIKKDKSSPVQIDICVFDITENDHKKEMLTLRSGPENGRNIFNCFMIKIPDEKEVNNTDGVVIFRNEKIDDLSPNKRAFTMQKDSNFNWAETFSQFEEGKFNVSSLKIKISNQLNFYSKQKILSLIRIGVDKEFKDIFNLLISKENYNNLPLWVIHRFK